jgi:hypothetical protein
MSVGLGTGSTAYYAVERIGQKIRSGELLDIKCIPSSERTRQQVNIQSYLLMLDILMFQFIIQGTWTQYPTNKFGSHIEAGRLD